MAEYLQHGYKKTRLYGNAGIVLRDLKSYEIRVVVLEMEGGFIGCYKDLDLDSELQEKFWKEFTSEPDCHLFHGLRNPDARLGAFFLKAEKR